jgi:glycosyltransferase involved in cell wall biosynthesis
MNNMKVCIIHSLWGRFARGGAEHVISLLITELQHQGNEVVVITTSPLENQIELERSGLKVYYLKSVFYNLNQLAYWQRFFWHILNAFNLRKYFEIKKIIEHEKPSMVWTHNILGFGFLILKLFKKRSYRHLHTLHDIQLLHPSGLLIWKRESIITSFVAQVYQHIIKSYFSNETIIISPSKWLLELHTIHGFFPNNSLIILPNPALLDTENGNPPEIPRSSEVVTFLFVGQIESHKGIEVLLEAFSLLTNIHLRLLVVGDGLMLSYLQKNNSDQRITFLGHKSLDEVKKIMKAADCLVVPSLCYENYPTVILEARGVLLPVIGSNFGGIKEMIKNEKFLFIPTCENIREKLVYFSENHQKIKTESIEHNDLFLLSVEDYLKRFPLN